MGLPLKTENFYSSSCQQPSDLSVDGASYLPLHPLVARTFEVLHSSGLTHVFVCLSVYLLTCLLVYLSICLSIYLAVYLSIYLLLSVYLPTNLSVCIIFEQALSIYVSVHLRNGQSI